MRLIILYDENLLFIAARAGEQAIIQYARYHCSTQKKIAPDGRTRIASLQKRLLDRHHISSFNQNAFGQLRMMHCPGSRGKRMRHVAIVSGPER
jgi:hypothetical protein